jgi:hypothetical protein
MRVKMAIVGIAALAAVATPAPSRAAVTTQHCVVINPGSTSCTVVFSPPVRDLVWSVVAPGGTWRLCETHTDGFAGCYYSWQFPHGSVTFNDAAALNFRFVKVTLQVLGPLVDGERVGFGMLASEPFRPLCVGSRFCF